MLVKEQPSSYLVLWFQETRAWFFSAQLALSGATDEKWQWSHFLDSSLQCRAPHALGKGVDSSIFLVVCWQKQLFMSKYCCFWHSLTKLLFKWIQRIPSDPRIFTNLKNVCFPCSCASAVSLCVYFYWTVIEPIMWAASVKHNDLIFVCIVKWSPQ